MASVYDPTASPMRLAPSDLTFLWEECRRCFWLKAKGVLKRPSAPFPKIFTRLDQQTKDYFFGKRTEEMAEGLRPGSVAFGDRWVRSGPLDVPGHSTQVVLAGRIDTALSFGDGSYGIIDFKTAEPKDEHVSFYGRQLHCYGLAAENPSAGGLRLQPVSTLGLLCVEPVSMVGLDDGVAYRATAHFLEIPRDDDAFLAFLPGPLRTGAAGAPRRHAGLLLLLLPRDGLARPADRHLRAVAVEARERVDTPLSAGAMVEAVLAHAASTGELATSTFEAFADVMGRFTLFMEQGLRIRDSSMIAEAEVRAFLVSRRADGGKPSASLTYNRRVVCRFLFRTARALGLAVSDPAVALELPARRPVPARPLTDEEVRRCRSRALFHPTDLRHPVAWAMAEASARTHEMTRVLVRDVDAASGSIRLGGSPRTDPRTVALTDWGLVQVRRRLRLAPTSPEAPLFPMRSRRVPRSSAAMAVIEVLRAAGVKGADVRPMSVVAWRAAMAYAEGASIEEVAVILGLRSLDRAAALIGLRKWARLPKCAGGFKWT